MTAFIHETAPRQDSTDADFAIEVARRIVDAGLALQDTAATAVDPLVRCKVQKALDDLDHVVRIVRDAVFSPEHRLKPCAVHNQPGYIAGDRDELVRYWLDQGESALDLAMVALMRVDELGSGSHSDLGFLRDKLAILRTLSNGQ